MTRLIRTLRYLKPVQICSRLTLPLRRRFVPTTPDVTVRNSGGQWQSPAQREGGWLSETEASWLNLTLDMTQPPNWHEKRGGILWCYHLHYFDDLPFAQQPWREDNLADWISGNPPRTPVSWDPYPISQRIVNWSKWILGGGKPGEQVRDSLALQAAYLERNLEKHLLANHYLANIKALVFAGHVLSGSAPSRWLKGGLARLEEEIAEQVLPDGGYFERSSLYHALALEDMLDLINLTNARPLEVAGPMRRPLRDAATRMLEALELLTHPDDEIAFFNDSAIGIAPRPQQLRDYARRLGLSWRNDASSLPDTGFARLHSPDEMTTLIFDCGAIGPDYQPGHSHCDTLSFELSREGRRLLVNSGTSTYEVGAERLRQRRTAAHNTLRIDGQEQSEVWASHRCGRRAHPLHAEHGDNRAEASHDGYHFLPGGPTHVRRIEVGSDAVLIDDSVKGRGEHLVEVFFHLHPDIMAKRSGDGISLIRAGKTVAQMTWPRDMEMSLEESTWHPGFNLSLPNRKLTCRARAELPFRATFRIVWEAP